MWWRLHELRVNERQLWRRPLGYVFGQPAEMRTRLLDPRRQARLTFKPMLRRSVFGHGALGCAAVASDSSHRNEANPCARRA